jgi:single-stranded DNA-binding protein
MVTGSIRRQDWVDKDGKKCSKHVLNVQRFEYLPRPKTEEAAF